MCRFALRDLLYLRPLYQFQWLRAHPVLHASTVGLLDAIFWLLTGGFIYCACLAIGWGVCSQYTLPVAGYALILLIYPLVGAILLLLLALAFLITSALGWTVAGRCASQAARVLQDYVTPAEERHEPQTISLEMTDAE